MFFGNSFIEGHDSPNLTWKGGARKVVEDLLTQKGARFNFVGRNINNSEGMTHQAHNGYGGLGIKELVSEPEPPQEERGFLAQWVVESKADLYVIDLGRKKEEGSEELELRGQFMKVLSPIFTSNSRSQVIWCEQVFPLKIWHPGEEQRLTLVNSVLAKTAIELTKAGRVMVVAKTARGWDPSIHLDADGVHPNDAGYRHLGRIQAEAIMKLALASGKIKP